MLFPPACSDDDAIASFNQFQSMMNSGYVVSATHLRLVHGEQCTGVGAIIPDTDGRGGWAGGGGGGKGGGGKGGGGGGGGSAIKSFFLFVLVTGAGDWGLGLQGWRWGRAG